MIGSMPKFFTSPNYVEEPVMRLLPEATDEEKAEFEFYMNNPYSIDEYREQHPEIRYPYYTWEGNIVEKSNLFSGKNGCEDWENFDEDANTAKMIEIEKKMKAGEIKAIEFLCTDEVMDHLPAGFFDRTVQSLQYEFPGVKMTKNVREYCKLFLKYNQYIQSIEGEFEE